jgi:hypothetical protein
MYMGNIGGQAVVRTSDRKEDRLSVQPHEQNCLTSYWNSLLIRHKRVIKGEIRQSRVKYSTAGQSSVQDDTDFTDIGGRATHG